MKTNPTTNESNLTERELAPARAGFRTHSIASAKALSTAHFRILLVDDDAGVRGSLSDVLASEGFVVIPANDGAHALERIAAIPVDLVLLDLNMPRKNGWDTFERLSTEHPLVPVIVITARPNQLFTAMGAGVGALLEKPLDMPTLLRTIRRLLAESAEIRLARLAGRAADFHYSAARS